MKEPKRKSRSIVPAPEQSDPRPKTAHLSASPPVLGKVCFICNYFPADNQPGGFSYAPDPSDVNHGLYLLDLDAETESNEFVDRNPYLCFNSFSLGIRGFCLLGSTLYFFGYSPALLSYELPSSFPPFGPRRDEVLTLTRDLLSDAPHMKYYKHAPWACQTPDGEKMVIFSTMLYISPGRSKGNFEMFDRRTKTWRRLADLNPQLTRLWREGCLGFFKYGIQEDYYAELHSCSFIDGGVVLVVNTSVGNFTLNTADRKSAWLPCDRFRLNHGRGYRDGVRTSMLVRGSLCLMDWFAWEDGTDQRKKLSYEGFSWAADKVIGGGMTWLSPKNRFCIVRSECDDVTRQPLFVVDAFDFDDSQSYLVGRWDDEVKGLILRKRFKFVGGPLDAPPLLATMCLAPIP